ncbi:MAG: hypothetical protein ACE37D_07530 [Pseudomonadales bacterium]
MANCQHSFVTQGATTAVAHMFADWQGLVSGLTQCQHCGAPAILQLLAWRGPRLAERVYSIALLPEAATEVFLRNMQSAYCDLTRQAHEVDALMNLGEIHHIGMFNLPELLCQGSLPYEQAIHHQNWQDIDPEDPTWWSLFANTQSAGNYS